VERGHRGEQRGQEQPPAGGGEPAAAAEAEQHLRPELAGHPDDVRLSIVDDHGPGGQPVGDEHREQRDGGGGGDGTGGVAGLLAVDRGYLEADEAQHRHGTGHAERRRP
jgi:hypothetical protein